MGKRGISFKKTLILSFLLFLFMSIPPVFASELNQSLTYDGNGNLITGDGRYREYNEFNQLIRVYNGSTNNSYYILEEYVYHPTEDRVLMKYWYEPGDLGRFYIEGAVVYINKNLEREYKNLEGAPDLNYTYYIYDETGIVEEIVKNASYYEDIYTHRTYLGPQISVKNLSYHNDYSGSVSLITNSSGGVVEETFYEPFGEILIGGNASRYSYEGKEFDSLTEDYDFHFRKYDPSLMIFTQPDSVVVNVYDPQTLNRYAFERNNPYKYVDEDGKSFTLIALALTGVFLFNFVVGIIRSSNENSQRSYAEFIGEGMYNSFGTDEGIVMTAAGIGSISMIGSSTKSSNTLKLLEQNRLKGLEGESRALKELGLTKNTKISSVVDPKTGKIVNTIPDFNTPKAGIGDIKNSKSVSYTSQLRAQDVLAKKFGSRATIVTGTFTRVSKNVLERFNIIRKIFLGPRR